MPSITISAVNTGTEVLTATGHGLLTGDRLRVRNTTGGALPTGLTGAVDVFAIRVDADNLKVSDTNAHALAGTNIIDITGAGTGTNVIEYGLPYCLPTAIAAPGTQIKSADLNGTWSSLVALYSLLVGQAQSIWSTIVVALTVTFNAAVTAPAYKLAATRPLIVAGADFAVTAGTPTLAGQRWTFPTSGTNTLVANLCLPPGAVISGLDFALNTSSTPIFTGQFAYDLTRKSFGDGGATSATVGSGTDSASSGWLAEPLSGLPHTVLGDTIYTLTLTTSGSFTSAPLFDGVRVIIDRA